jgi:hypothetical protein
MAVEQSILVLRLWRPLKGATLIAIQQEMQVAVQEEQPTLTVFTMDDVLMRQ